MKPKLTYLSTLTAVGVFLAAGPSLAQTTDVTNGGGSGTTEATAPAESGGSTNEGAFEALSPGGQKIARALFDAQKQPESDGNGGTDSTGGTAASTGGEGAGTTEAAAPRSLDDIAAAKAGTGWGQVFKEMQAEGLIAEKNLGQVISGANHRNRLGTGDGTESGTDTGTGTGTETGTDTGTTGSTTAPASAATAAQSAAPSGHRTKPVTVTLGNGATVVVGGHGRGHAPRGDAAVDATGIESGTNRGHGGGAGNAGGRASGAVLGNGAAAGYSGHGANAGGPGVNHGGGQGQGTGRGLANGRGR